MIDEDEDEDEDAVGHTRMACLYLSFFFVHLVLGLCSDWLGEHALVM